MSWLGGLFTGSNPTLSGDIGNAGNVAGFGIGTGEGAISTGLGFEEGLLSGNEAEEAKLLAPEISNISQQANQKTQTNAQFGNRSGGTNASNQTTGDTARANVDNMISQLTGQAAGAVTQTGENLLGTGLSATELQGNLSQEQMQNQRSSILGGALSGAVSAGLGAATGGISGLFSGGGGANPYETLYNAQNPDTSLVSTLSPSDLPTSIGF